MLFQLVLIVSQLRNGQESDEEHRQRSWLDRDILGVCSANPNATIASVVY